MSARIYVACLAAYNNGQLHGEWIDASTDVDDMHEQVQTMLAASHRAWDHVSPSADLRACHQGNGNAQAIARLLARRAHAAGRPGPAPCTEEWAILDHEGLPGIGEYSSLDDVAEIVRLLEDHDEDLVLALLAHCDGATESREMLEDHGYSCAESREDLAFEILGDVPDRLVSYIDVDAVLRDFDCSGGLIIEVGGMVYGFT